MDTNVKDDYNIYHYFQSIRRASLRRTLIHTDKLSEILNLIKPKVLYRTKDWSCRKSFLGYKRTTRYVIELHSVQKRVHIQFRNQRYLILSKLEKESKEKVVDEP